MTSAIAPKLEIDSELARLIQASPSINAMPRTEREQAVLQMFLLSEAHKYELRDVFLAEARDMAEASASQMHERYGKLKEIYETLVNMKRHLQGDVRNMKESKDKAAEADLLQKLDDQIENAI